jgi:hypothetical protein
MCGTVEVISILARLENVPVPAHAILLAIRHSCETVTIIIGSSAD